MVTHRCAACEKDKPVRAFGMQANGRPRNQCLRCRHLKEKYAFSDQEYDELFKKQEGRCAICRRAAGDTRYTMLYVDHDHRTGKIRGLLCTHCNTGLCKLGDTEVRLRWALDYLKGIR